MSKIHEIMFRLTRPLYVGLFIIPLLSLFSLTQAAPFDNDRKTIDSFLREKKYFSAANYIYKQPSLLDQPEFIREFIQILDDYHAYEINHRLIALRDLAPNETMEDVRGDLPPKN